MLVAAVNALPSLFAVFEAACAWRDALTQGSTNVAVTAGIATAKLLTVIDTARGNK